MNNLKKSISLLIKESKEEFVETKAILKLMWKSRKQDLTHEEKQLIKGQSVDILRLTVLTSLFIIPFSGIFIILLIKFGKKLGIRVLPSSFK